MPDPETKRRINTARDILVGKVPDPKSQVEQITIALIYKFMADMDAESEEMGGKRTFFSGEWERYGWPKLMRSGLGGHEVLALYGEAISKMPENAGIPTLFRDIFKNAYLPYRDPETLKSFLKVIDEFEYDHSERLGDAFEYLLSVLGSQGDAGQFRTPRHIIDFMVEIIDPKKDETVLDPACGTAGFLISSYKHIDRNNRDKDGNSTLTPDDKGRLAKNFKGYDISPDMVRLSLVNLYLHGFSDPHIDEYDTLTSDDKWNQFVDVILANPPFMSPKGGIKPHKRFSVQSKRSEVLFVDYIAEHLTPSGRAAIIVPEGIIFQGQTAYKQLRKMLVDEHLVAVISLPAGVFQPYSGVKTSILVFDKSLAKQSDTIGFFKVEHDGFMLGAQRRETDKNDLPQIKLELEEYLDALRNKEDVSEIQPKRGVVVEKEKIAENEEYNLSGERYRDTDLVTAAYPLVPLSKVARVKNGFAFKSAEYEDDGLRVMRIKNVQKGEVVDNDPKFIAKNRESEFADYSLKAGDLLISLTGNVGRVGRLKVEHEPAVLNQRVAHVELLKGSQCLLDYLFALLNTERFEADSIDASSGVAQANLSSKWVGNYQIPLPPLEVQKEIVAEIESYQKVIDGARAVLDNYRPHIPIHPDWPMGVLGDGCNLIGGFAFKSSDMQSEPATSNDRKVLKIGNVGKDGRLLLEGIQYHEFSEKLERYTLRTGDAVVAMTGATVGKAAVVDQELILLNQRVGALRAKEGCLQEFILWLVFDSKFYDYCQRTAGGGAQGNISPKEILKYPIPLPSPEIQKAIVTEIQAEQSLVAANRELIERMEKKIQAVIARVWGEEETEAE
ncbi:MAG: N-6 DNA methylase [Verrucomicrobiota bacterium]